MNRIIFLIDLDSFYAQCEENRKPELNGKPVVVGMFTGRTDSSGVVATANYKARELGIKSAMPLFRAKKLANEYTVFLPADRDYYSEISVQAMQFFSKFAETLEQVSIDEAFLDVTKETNNSFVKAKVLAKEIKHGLKEELSLSCSIGISSNKLIAKMAASVNKPDGLTIVKPEQISRFLNPLKVGKLHGVGKVTSEKLHENGIETIQQLSKFPVFQLSQIFGENKAKLLHNMSIGKDDSLVIERTERQQMSALGTIKADSSDFEEISPQIKPFAERIFKRIKEKGLFFKTATIILISNKNQMHTKSKTLEKESNNLEEFVSVSKELLKDFLKANPEFVVKRFGVRVSNFVESKKQKSLFEFDSK